MTSSQSAEAHALTRPQKAYVWFACLSAACLLVSDVVGIKLFSIPLGFSIPVPWGDGGIRAIEHTCGMLTFPLTFIITDLVNDFYGKKAARRIAYTSLSMGVLAFMVINLAQAMPRLDASFNVSQQAFDAVFGSAKGMYVASLAAYLVGSLADIFIFGVFKRLTGGRYIWLRATGSTIISQFIDSCVVSYVAFHLWRTLYPDPGTPPAPLGEILKIAATGYMLKFCLALAATPVIYLGHGFLRVVCGLTPIPAQPK
ncbi:MAG: queuosine precursor transporter [Phycisphaerae bacterium]|jgi:hypothetical protein